jgi:hypothetical protein
VNGITLDNVSGTATDILATINATNLEYETTGGSGKCGTQNTKFTCGVFEGKLTIQALDASEKPVNIAHS